MPAFLMPRYFNGHVLCRRFVGWGGRECFWHGEGRDNALGTPGTARRRFFSGPGLDNYDMALLKTVGLTESKSLQFRLEGFNIFNHAQFFGPQSVDGNIGSPSFGQVVSANPPRLVQVAQSSFSSELTRCLLRFSICLARFGEAHAPVLDCANGYQKENQKAAREVKEDRQQEGNAEEETGEEKSCSEENYSEKSPRQKGDRREEGCCNQEANPSEAGRVCTGVLS
jgi:hypothetical protein